jgi:phage RecT family recombinase
MTMTTEIATTEARPAKSAALAIKDWMSAPTMQSALEAALTGYMDPKTFAAQCYLAAQDPKLAACSAPSLFRAFLECAQMGLLPGKHHGHVALVPRGGVVTATPEWRGFKFLMERQPGIRRVQPVLVHAKDKFEFADGVVHHAPDPFDDERVFEHPDVAKKNNRACGLRGGYLIIERADGTTDYHFVGAAKIHRNRSCAETQSIWTKWFEEMCLKTVLRDAWSKRVVSIDPQLAQRLGAAEERDNAALGNDPARVALPAGAVAPAPTAPASRTAALAARIAGPAREVPSTGVVVSDEQLPDMAHAPTAPADEPAEPAAAQAPETPPAGPPLSEKAQALALDIQDADPPAFAGLRKRIDDGAKKGGGLTPAEVEHLRKLLAATEAASAKSEREPGGEG